MQLSGSLTSSTFEASESGHQAVDAVLGSAARLAAALPDFTHMGGIHIGLSLIHPLAIRRASRASARYAADADTVFAQSAIDYSTWVAEDWSARVGAVAAALAAAVRAVAKSRLTASERAALVSIIQAGSEQAKASPPERLSPLGPVHLIHGSDGGKPAISFDVPLASALGERIETLLPSALADYVADHAPRTAEAPAMFKLYALQDGRLNYHEAWIADGQVVEHWGVCGERGETRRGPISLGGDPSATLESLRRQMLDTGFKSIPPSRHKGLIVEKPIEDMSPAELDRRHALQAFLDDKLGWLGLGHCDGGSMGSGSIEAYCLVVDGMVALEAMTREVANSPFSDYRIGLSSDGR